MTTKPKRKHNTRLLLKLKLMLVAYTVVTVLITTWIPFWFAPPLDGLTPFVYSILLLSWIPIVWRIARRIQVDNSVIILVLLCSIVSSISFNRSDILHTGSAATYNNEQHLMIGRPETCWTTNFFQVEITGVGTNLYINNGTAFFLCY